MEIQEYVVIFISLRLERKQIEFPVELEKLIISPDSRACSGLSLPSESYQQSSIHK